MLLDSKVIVITGATQGLGKTLARKCVEHGAIVAAIGRDADKLSALESDFPGRVVGFAGDICDPHFVRALFKDVDRRFSRLDGLVNNAGIYPPFKLEKATDEQLLSVFGTNVLGAMYCSREAVPLLRQSEGDIVNISSEAVRFNAPMLSVYAASKAALEKFSMGLRVELAPSGVRVSILRVGHMHRHDEVSLPTEVLEELFACFEETGYKSVAGQGMEQSTVAETIIQMLSLPGDANMDLLELRSRH